MCKESATQMHFLHSNDSLNNNAHFCFLSCSKMVYSCRSENNHSAIATVGHVFSIHHTHSYFCTKHLQQKYL